MHGIPRYYSLVMIDLCPRTLALRTGLAGRFRLAAMNAAGPRAPVPRERSAD